MKLLGRFATAVALVAPILSLSAQTKSSAADNAASAVLTKAAKAVTSVKSLAFSYSAKPVQGGFSVGAVAGGEGEAESVNRLVFRGSIQQTPALAMPFVLVGCGDTQFIDMGDGKFTPMPSNLNIGKLFIASENSFVADLLKGLESPTKPVVKDLDKLKTNYIKAKLPKSVMAYLPGAVAETAADVELWIGEKDNLVRKIVITGILFNGDVANTARTISLTRYNEKIVAKVAGGALPCKDTSGSK